MKILDRYICRGFVFAYVVCFAIMICLYIMIDLLLNLDEFTEQPDYTVAKIVVNILNYYGYNLFLYFSQLAGTITVVAALITVGLMLRNNELTALLASGVSMYRVAAPLLIMAVAAQLLWVVDHEVVIPRIKHKLARTHDDIEGLRTLEIWFYRSGRPDGGSDLISAKSFAPNEGRMEDVVIIERNRAGTGVSTISADFAQWDPKRECWDLSQGRAFREMIRVEGQDKFPMAGRKERQRIFTYPGRVRPEYLELRQSAQWYAFLSLRELENLAAQGDLVDRSTVARSKHARFTAPITNILLVVLTLPWFLTSIPQTVIHCASKALGVFVCSLIFAVVCVTGGPEGYEAFFCWLPIIVLSPVAVFVVDAVKT